MKHRALTPVAVIAGGVALAALLVVTGPRVEPQPREVVPPLVRTVVAKPQKVQLRVLTHGTVVPRTESELVPEVSGPVTWISPSLVSGGFFREGDPLLRIDPLDTEVALEQSRAGLARARSEYATAEKERKRQLDLAERDIASAAKRDDAVNRFRVAEASLREAKAKLARAERDLARTELRAPYDGLVRSERVDVGQFVNRGSSVATIYAVDFAEVRLPIHDDELAYLELPLAARQAGPTAPIPVVLRARFAGAEHEWRGEVVRTEGELDPRTRMVNVVARVAEPYGGEDGRPPLAVGLFVDAEILGAEADDVVVLPRAALREGGVVLVVDAEQKLRFRDVQVLREEQDHVYVERGLRSGERVCVSPINAPVEGMAVRVVGGDTKVAVPTPGAEPRS